MIDLFAFLVAMNQPVVSNDRLFIKYIQVRVVRILFQIPLKSRKISFVFNIRGSSKKVNEWFPGAKKECIEKLYQDSSFLQKMNRSSN